MSEIKELNRDFISPFKRIIFFKLLNVKIFTIIMPYFDSLGGCPKTDKLEKYK
jgi:hypothetical protein